MAIRYILGRSGTGKTERCLGEIGQQLRGEPEGAPLVLLVPEQATFQAEHALVSAPGLGGSIRAQVFSFRRLAYRIMQELGGTARVHIDDNGKKMLLYDLLHQHGDELKQFRTSSDQAGFIDQLNRMYGEFRRHLITPDKLELFFRQAEQRQEPGEGSNLPLDKLHDLLLIYRRFEEILSEHYLDSEHLLTQAADMLAESSYIREARVWIDGFYSFNPQEMRFIGELMRHSEQTTISLCVDRDYASSDSPDELGLFYPAAKTLVRLKRLAEELSAEQSAEVLACDPPERFRRSPKLAHLESALEYRSGRAYRGRQAADRELVLAAAVSRRAEAEGAARELVRLVRDEGYRWRDMAIMVRNLEQYGDVLAVTFADYGIPFFIDQRRSVLHHPVVELIRSSLEVVAGRWRTDAIFRCVKTELLLPPELAETAAQSAALRDAMCRLENYVLAAGIHGSRFTEAKRWSYRVGSMLDDVQEGAAGTPDESFYTEMDGLRRLVARPLKQLDDDLRKAGTVRDMAESLFRYLESTQAAARLEVWSRGCLEAGEVEKAREHSQVWGSVIDLLDQIVEMLGGETMTVDRFAGIVETGLESATLGLVPPSLDQVLIGTIDRTRSGEVRHLFVLGANDGVIPARPQEDGVLSEPERERMTDAGLELADGSRRKLLDESFLLYKALTTPSDSLWISYPLADEEGKSLLPSEIVKRLRAMFPALKERLLLIDAPSGETETAGGDPYEYAVHPGKALSHLAVQLRQWIRGVKPDDVWWEIYNWFVSRPEWRGQVQRILRSLLYTNREDPLPDSISRELYGELLKASVSRMERFVSCPFSQFASHGLKLAERHVYRLDAPDIGQLFHAALSKIALELQREGIHWGALTPEQCDERASQAVQELVPRLQGEILLSSKRFGYIARKLKQIVSRASVVLGVHARRGEFVPVGLEVGFGPGQPLPPLEFELGKGRRMQIVGRIDRVDRASGDKGVLLRIIDYKSSETSLRLADVFYGLSLQMLTYLDVVITHAEKWLGTPAMPAGVLYFHVHNPLLRRKNTLSEEAAEAEALKRFKMKGLVLGDPETVRLMDHSLRERSGHSELIPVALKADGSFYQNSSVVSEQQWQKLSGYVRTMIARIGEQIAGGNVDIKPIRSGAKLACTYCPYKPVCAFEPITEESGYNRLQRIEKEAVWQAIESAAGDLR
ncbi:helicase-exonuclease AddAB subunit AddB [Paenibacillus ginsengarvi]|uniref:ATP-dependent helicase/deoxyribonuclease subunit B n=2 Tax=Paenibacillus ginsengarvi TaxID=400777 RepID=A0A3B0CNW5_9BACL|nr:helicase-exonuclease AddAB subunit AddB [Paenibacillus ginsengarvi]